MMFEPIIQYFISKGELHERAAEDARSFATWLEDQTAYTTSRLQDVITRINYETIQPDKSNCFPTLEFWRGVDDFGSSAALNYDGGVDIRNDITPVVKNQYDHGKHYSDEERIKMVKARMAIPIDTNKYPLSLLGHYEYRLNDTAMFYTWMAYLWQEIEGHQCGIKVATVQNNSVARFSLNDFLCDHFSAFMENEGVGRPPRIGKFFPRKLTIVELFLRANQTGYPFNPYKNYWRYFERGDEFKEIVTYECTTGIRSGKRSEVLTAEVTRRKQHDNSKSALMWVTDFVNHAIFDGWEEKFRPAGLPEQMHDSAYDFGFWTGVSWYKGEEETNRLKAADLFRFEQTHKIKLPDAFFQYMRLFNGRQYNQHELYFPIDDLYTVHVKKFYTLEELNQLALATGKQNSTVLWIGILTSEELLGININAGSEDYGKVITGNPTGYRVNDYSFEKFARYAQSSPVQPELFAARENNVLFLRKRLAEGWDYNTVYMYRDALQEAAEHNAYQTLELLLQAGARLKNKNHRSVTWLYDNRTMDLLDQYP